MVKLVKAGKKQAKPKKAAPPPPPPPEDFEESTSEEESEEEELLAPPVKKTATLTAKATRQPVNKKNGKAVKKESSEDEEDDDDDEEDDESEESEKRVTKQAANLIEKGEDDEEEEEEEEDDEEDDESEEEEAMDTVPPPKVKKTAMAKVKNVKGEEEEEDDDDEEDDNDDDDDDDDDDDEEEEEDDDDEETNELPVPVKAGKRKKEEQKTVTPAKKQKISNCAFSLFVGNLNSEKNLDELKKALNDFFTKKKLAVTSVRIGSSRKFGYVDFETEEQLTKALTFNGNKVLGQVVKLDKARKENNLGNKKERDDRTLFVKNLPFKTTQDDLREIFEDAIDIRIPSSRDGTGSRGIAYIEFETEATAQMVLNQKQGMEVEGRSIILDFTGIKSTFKGGQTEQGSDTLMVNNLAFSATEMSLRNIFEKASSFNIPERNGRSRGFAIVKFASIEDAKEALESCNNTEIEGRNVRLEFFNQGGSGGASKTLFVRGLSDDTTEETLKEAFEGAESARIVTERESGRSKGFGFVDFASEEDAKSAKEMMDDGEIDGCKITLDFARPKNESQRGGRGRGGPGGMGRGGFGGRGRGGFGGRGRGGRGGFGGFRGGKMGNPQSKKYFD
ncbi:nucleolin isoform X2 [Narcine bancroftii]|uniref:nucleolin isoform X2 n=1 Tax=Narcine bancroftii TaxID=1343680 RepID=UPI0038314189